MSNLPVPSGGWNTSIATKQRGRESTAPPDDNQPEIGAIIAEEDRLIADARKAGVEIQKATQKTFEAWITLARGVRAARNRADRIKGKKVFEHILAQERLDKVLGNTPASIKATASRLLKILEHEAEVMLWRAGLSDYERMQWSSPASVCSRCPALKFKGEPGEEKAETEKKPTPTERIRALEADNAHLREELARYDTSEPVQKPGKAKGAKGFLEAWKPIREALKDVPSEERLKVLTTVQDEIREEIAGLTEVKAVEAKAPATPAEAVTLMERKARLRRADPHDPEMWDKVDTGEMTLEEAERELGLA